MNHSQWVCLMGAFMFVYDGASKTSEEINDIEGGRPGLSFVFHTVIAIVFLGGAIHL